MTLKLLQMENRRSGKRALIPNVPNSFRCIRDYRGHQQQQTATYDAHAFRLDRPTCFLIMTIDTAPHVGYVCCCKIPIALICKLAGMS
jgi:hypothetical protein